MDLLQSITRVITDEIGEAKPVGAYTFLFSAVTDDSVVLIDHKFDEDVGECVGDGSN